MLHIEEPKPKKKLTKKNRSIPSAIFIVLMAILVSVSIIFSIQQFLKKYNENVGSTAKTETVFGAPSIGGEFLLTDQNGNVVTNKDFLGKYILVFFGYSYCPDVCPTALTNLSDAIDILDNSGKNIVPVFITIDPDRDTVLHLKEYAEFFHPRLIALTGTKTQIKRVAKAYRVYFAKAQETKNDPEDYLMDHSAVTYMMGPDGRFLGHFSHGLDSQLLAQRIKERL